MATKAERFRYEQERSAPSRPKRPPRRRRDTPVDTSKPGVSATNRKAGGGASAARNKSKSAAKKAPYQLEDSRKRPSRKSTRRGANRKRQDAQLWKRQVRRATSPSRRARGAKAGNRR
jgi:hypothetical protein